MLGLPNPRFQPETHLLRPGAWAPSRKVPSQICAVLRQKLPFYALNGPSRGAKHPNEGKQLLHFMCGLMSMYPWALCTLWVLDMSKKPPKKGVNKPRNLRNPRNLFCSRRVAQRN